jgi:hypothetical protein
MDDTSFRTRIGSYLVIGSTIALTVLAAIMVTAAAFGKGEVKEVVQTTFSSLLPMFGTWVGTVLAFYFSKENFEAANRGTIDMVKAVGQRLGSIPVVQKMIPASQVISLRLAPNQAMGTVKISDVEALFAKSISGKKISRLLVLDSSGACVAVVHRSLYMEAFASALRATPAVDPAVDTIAKLLAIGYPSPPPVTYQDFFTSTIAYVSRDSTLADAKSKMEAIPGCQDVVVTAVGANNEPVLGWISNVDIGRASVA